jgi:hypothetical protein
LWILPFYLHVLLYSLTVVANQAANAQPNPSQADMKRAYDALGLNVSNLVGPQGNVLRAVPGGPRMAAPPQVAVSIATAQQPPNMAPGNVNVRLIAPPQQGMKFFFLSCTD